MLPASAFLEAVHNAYGARGYWLVPTLAWVNSSTLSLQILCAAGAAAGGLLVAGRFTRTALIAAWALYLSLLGVGQVFLSFQWDLLLLETGVLALLATLWPEWVAWLFRWLLFRLMFLSGAVKLLSGDESWRQPHGAHLSLPDAAAAERRLVVRAPASSARARSGHRRHVRRGAARSVVVFRAAPRCAWPARLRPSRFRRSSS